MQPHTLEGNIDVKNINNKLSFYKEIGNWYMKIEFTNFVH